MSPTFKNLPEVPTMYTVSQYWSNGEKWIKNDLIQNAEK